MRHKSGAHFRTNSKNSHLNKGVKINSWKCHLPIQLPEFVYNADMIAVICSAVAFLIYLNTLHADFVYDDNPAIVRNPDVYSRDGWRELWSNDFWGTPLSHTGSHKSYRPLTVLSFRINYYFSGFDPSSYHMTNILMHSLCTWLFVKVARLLFNYQFNGMKPPIPLRKETKSSRHQYHRNLKKLMLSDKSIASSGSCTSGAKKSLSSNYNSSCKPSDCTCPTNEANRNYIAVLSSSLLFAAHPIHTEAVAGVVGRADVCATTLALSSFICYLKYMRQRENNKVIINLCQTHLCYSDLQGYQVFDSRVKSALWITISIALATAAMFTKEQGITVLPICALYDLAKCLTTSCRRQERRSIWKLECNTGLLVTVMSTLGLLHLRLNIIGSESPMFSKADNPTSHEKDMMTRFMTFMYLPVFNFFLLIWPQSLSYDWSMDAIPRITRVLDHRNLISLAFLSFFISVLISCMRSVLNLRALSFSCVSDKQPKCCLCRNSSFGGKVVNNNLLLKAKSSSVSKMYSVTGGSKSCVLPRISMSYSYPPLSRYSWALDVPLLSPNPKFHPRDESTLMLNEKFILLIQMAFLIVPFIPATNLFFYVGFVVAERVLYMPSVGFCLLFGHCVYHFWAKAKDSTLLKTIIVASVVITLISMGVRTAQRNEDWKDEVSLYRSGIHINPPKSWGNLGTVLSNRGRLYEAEEAYRNALHFRPNMADVHYNLGLLLEAQERYTEAIEAYRSAITFRAHLAQAYVSLGQVLSRVGRTQEAIQVYEKCYQLDGSGTKDLRSHIASKISALLLLGKIILEENKDAGAAIQVYHKAVALMPSDYESKQNVYNGLGEAVYRTGNVMEAEKLFKMALEIKPDHVPAHLTYGKMLSQNKTRLLEAESWFRRARKIAPLDASVYHHYGQFLSIQGRYKEAAEAYIMAESLSPGDYDIAVGTANALRQSGENLKAEIYYRKAVSYKPKEAKAHMNLGAMLHLNKKYDDAEKSYMEALNINPGDEVTVFNLKRLRQAQNQNLQSLSTSDCFASGE